MLLNFEVSNVFRLTDGRTVFVGRPAVRIKYITACMADVVSVDGPVCQVRLEPEMIPMNPADRSLRSVATQDRVPAEIGAQQAGGIRLRLHVEPVSTSR